MSPVMAVPPPTTTLSAAGVKRKKFSMGQAVQTMEREDSGRLTGSSGLTELQQAVMIAFAAQGTVTEAARMVGCSPDVASRLMRLAHVQAALHGECRQMLARAAPIAIATLTMLAEHPDIRMTRLGLDASKALLDRVGLGPVKAGEGQGDGKRDLSDLSMDELAAFILQGQETLARKTAVPAEGTISE